MYHVPLVLQCIYGHSDERGKNVDREEGSEISGGGKILGIAWPLVCRMTWFYVVSRRKI